MQLYIPPLVLVMVIHHQFCSHKGGGEGGGVRGGALGRAHGISRHIRWSPGAYRGRRLRAPPDGATSSSGQAAALWEAQGVAEEEPGPAEGVSVLLQPARSQGWRSDVCTHGASVPSAGEPAGTHTHSHLHECICVSSGLMWNYLSCDKNQIFPFFWLCRNSQWSSCSLLCLCPQLCLCCLLASPQPRRS